MTMIVIIIKMTTKTTTTMIVMINQDLSSTAARLHFYSLSKPHGRPVFAVCLTSSMGRSAAVHNREGNQDGDGNVRNQEKTVFGFLTSLQLCLFVNLA